jgi:hypothetical protein
VNKMPSSQDSNEPQREVEQQLAALRQELEAARSERDEALSSLAALQKATKAAYGADVVTQNGVEDGQVVGPPQSTPQDADHDRTSSEKTDTSLPIGSRRQFRKQILSRKVTKTMLRKAIKLYDLEKAFTSQSPESLSALERLFGLDDIEWPSEHDRLSIISSKVEIALKRTLASYGCVFSFLSSEIKPLVTFFMHRYTSFTFYGENQKGRLRISPPRVGQDPPKLPEWLQIPYLVPVKGINDKITLEGCANPCVQRGDKIFEGYNTNMVGTFGTLGTLMVSQQSQRLTYVGLTAGHVIPDGDNHILVQNPKDKSMIDLKVARYSVRYDGRPLGRKLDSPSFRDDCAFLIVDQKDLPHFDHSIPCIDLHFYNSEKTSSDNALDPLSASRREDLKVRLSESPLVVYKRGASTDLTMGYLTEINDEAPNGWYQPLSDEEDDTQEEGGDGIVFEDEDTEDDTQEEDGDGNVFEDEDTEDDTEEDGDGNVFEDEDTEDDTEENEWIGIVKWADNVPFSAPGDSGSLVFALEGGITIPLGIHVGAPGSKPQHSAFISIETFCYEAEKEGWSLQFTERPQEAVGPSTTRISQSDPTSGEAVSPPVPPRVPSPPRLPLLRKWRCCI